MSLEPEIKPKTKKERARDLALQYKNLTYNEARTKIMEEVPCSKTTAHKAIRWVQKQEREEEGVKPELEVVPEEKKKPEFLEEEKPIEEIKPEKPAEAAITPEEAAAQFEFFRDMLRGVHVLIASNEGILGEKYGRPKDQCIQVSDQLYRWMRRRVTLEELEKYDTILLGISYTMLIGGIAKTVVDERRKKKTEGKKD